jgi:FtsZ-binding cell division protein ZapB
VRRPLRCHALKAPLLCPLLQQAQVQSLVGEKASLSSYAGTLQQQIGAMESETEHLKVGQTERRFS